MGPLAGIGVVEIGGDVAVRYCGRMFAQHGAAVWRVPGGPALDPLFAAWLDEGKTAAADVATVLAAARGCEKPLAVAGQYRAEIADAQAALGGAVPLLSINWFDPRGAYANWRANDALMQAMTGVAFSFGPVEGPPTLPQGHAPQIVGGLTGFIAALAGLMGETPPRRIETSIFEAALCFAETGAVGMAVLGYHARRLGVNRFSPTCPCGLYRASDGAFVGVTALTGSQWVAFAELMGRPDMARDPRFATTLQRLAAGDEMHDAVRAAIATKPAAWWVERGDALRIPLTPAPPPGALPQHPHWQGRGAFATLADGVQAPTSPFRFDFDGARQDRPSGGPEGPLAGVRVADFSMGWAGPLATRYLADLGADVLKIESSLRRDWWRGWDPAPPDADPPPYEMPRNFMAVNRNKRGLDLDLALPEDHAAAEAIVRLSDLVLENQGPGVMDKLKLGPADQRRLNPAAVSVTMPPFGAAGPLAGLRAYGSTVEQASGMPFLNGRAEWDPSMQHVAYGDAVAGLYGAAAALVGLFGRQTLGAARIEVCQVECLFQLAADGIIHEQALAAPHPRTGSRRAGLAPCAVVRAQGEAEAWLTVAVDSDTTWQSFAAAIERPDLAVDPALATLAGRKAREDEIETALAAWAADKDPRIAADALQAAGVAASMLLGTHDLFPDPQLQDCDYWAFQVRRYVGDHFTPQAPFRHDGERPPVVRPAPTLGEHTDEVLAELGIRQAP